MTYFVRNLVLISSLSFLLASCGGGIEDTKNNPSNISPNVNAGTDKTVTLGNQVQLTGSASDDGLPNNTLSLTWTMISGPGTATFSNPSIAQPMVSFSAAGTYVLRLTASDSALSAFDNVSVQVSAVNQAPVVNAGTDKTVTLGNQVQLTGSASDDGLPSNTLNLTWTRVSGPGTATFSNANIAQPMVSFSAAGTYVLRLTASDSALSAFDNVSVQVSAVNQAPVVNAGTDKTVTLGNQVQLTGSASDDGLPNNTLSLTWTMISGPGTATFSNPSIAQPMVSFSAAGTYVLRLTASDSALSAFDNVSVQVSAVNQAPVVNAGTDKTVTLGNQVQLTGSASDDGLPNNTLSLTWTMISGPGTATFSNPSIAQPMVSFSAAGTYVLRLTASDSALSAFDNVSVQVNSSNGNNPLNVNAGPDRQVFTGQALSMDATVTDDGLPVGGTLTSSWQVVSGPGNVTFKHSENDAWFDQPGDYVIRLVADDGALSASDDIQVTVLSADATSAPAAIIHVSPQIQTGYQVVFDGADSWSRGNKYGHHRDATQQEIDTFQDRYEIASFDWDFGDGNQASGEYFNTVTHVFNSPGTYTVTLTVTDYAGRTAQTTQSVIVTDLPTVTVNGNTDVDIQTAIDSLGGVPGIVFIPSGEYTISTAIRIAANTIIMGQGQTQPRLYNSTGGYVFVSWGNNVRVSNLEIYGDGYNYIPGQPYAYAYHGLGLGYKNAYVDNNHIHHLNFANVLSPFGVFNATATFENNNIHHNHKPGYGYGIAVWQESYAMIRNNTFSHNRHSVASNGFKADNELSNTGYDALYNILDGESDVPQKNAGIETHATVHGRVRIVGNIFRNMSYAIGLRDGWGEIKDNLFEEVDIINESRLLYGAKLDTPALGLEEVVDGGPYNVVVENNQFNFVGSPWPSFLEFPTYFGRNIQINGIFACTPPNVICPE